MILEYFRVLLINRTTHRVSRADNVIDNQLLRNKQKRFLRWYIFLRHQPHQLPMPAKRHRIINLRVLGTILLQPLFERLVFLLLLKFGSRLIIHNSQRIDVLLLACRYVLLLGENDVLRNHTESVHIF